MDPCPFVRVLVANLALNLPVVATRPSLSGVHPSASPCFCKIRLNNFPYQTSILPVSGTTDSPPPSLSAVFHLGRADLARITTKSKSLFPSQSRIKIAVYTGRRGSTCGVSSGRLLAKLVIPIDLSSSVQSRPQTFHSGWVAVGKDAKTSGGAQLHLTLRSEPDPRFVFEFDGEPECSPQVFQLQGRMRQPVFTCNFSCRNNINNNNRSGLMESNSARRWLGAFGSERERPAKERKGWSVTVHDLSGSPVALASMVTPFVASPGTDRVSRSNPGAWLILRPGDGTWKPWGRLEAWRERGGGSDGLGYRFEVLPDTHMTTGIWLAESSISARKGGKFTIDLTGNAAAAFDGPSPTTPECSPHGSGDFGYGLWPFASYRGFVMSSTVEGEGRCSRPVVEVGVQHVGCAEDAAAYVALAAAIDLSMDACRLFSQRLRQELSQSQPECFG